MITQDVTQDLELPAFDATNDPLPAVISDRYEILGLVGIGGMGSVYRVRDRALDEIVALKFLRREMLANEKALDRFRDEAKLARRVSHVNVARTFDIGEHDGEKFLTMEFIDGESLTRVLQREGYLSPRRTVELARQLCAGLAAAHAAGVIHSDLKPDNVLIEKSGRVVIGDFGIARAEGGDDSTSGMVGTPPYMSPEQVEERALDARSDIYALGAMLFEMLSGQRAWSGTDAMVVAARRLFEPPPNPRSVRPELPASLADVVVRCMARNEQDRYGRASEVAAALDAALAQTATGEVLSTSSGNAGAMPIAARVHRVAPAPQERDTAVAVLGFKNRGPSEDDYLADELTDELTDVLSMSGVCRVRPRRLVQQHDASDFSALARALDVQVIVEGAIRRSADHVRISARAIGVAEGLQVWAGTFEAASSEVLAVNEKIARALLEAFAGRAPAAQAPRPLEPMAVELYLRARQALRGAWGGMGDLDLAVELFRQALTRAPDDGSLLSGYAMARARRYNFRGGEPGEIAAIRVIAERATVEAPHLGEPWLTLATVMHVTSEWPDAVRALRKALHLAPGLLKAHELLAHMEVEVGRIDEGLFRLETVMSLDPMPSSARWEAARVYAMRTQWDRMDALLAMPVQDEADRLMQAAIAARLDLWTGRGRERLLSEEEALGDPRRLFARAFGFVLRERHVPAWIRDMLEATLQRTAPHSRLRVFMLQCAAEIHVAGGEPERALEYVANAVDADLYDRAWLEGCALLEPLRAHPSWPELAARVEERCRLVIAALDAPSV